jgi:uridine monophosphate synthetase
MIDILGFSGNPEGLSFTQSQLADELFRIKAIKFGEFKLKLHDTRPEAPLSPIYIDLRVLRRFPDAKSIAVSAYEELIQGLEYDLLADVPTAATPLVSSLSDRLAIGMVTPRTDSKTHGSGAKVDGLTDSDRGKVALLVDDLVTRADSKLKAAKVLMDNGLVVNDVVVLVDRGQGGKEELQQNGLALHSAMNMDQLMDYYTRVGQISLQERTKIDQGLQDLNDFLASTKKD